jgi:hypothetical protein
MKRTIVIKDADESVASTGWRIRAALTLGCALAADGLQWLVPFLWPVCDVAMVIAVLILWGWRWEVMIALIPELIPGLELAPSWTIFAGYIIMARADGSARERATKTPPRI